MPGELEPWDIAVMPVCDRDGAMITVEFATNDEFQRYIEHNGIVVDDAGIVEWSFSDRCGVINHAIQHGVTLSCVVPENSAASETAAESEELLPATFPGVKTPIIDGWVAIIKAELQRDTSEPPQDSAESCTNAGTAAEETD